MRLEIERQKSGNAQSGLRVATRTGRELRRAVNIAVLRHELRNALTHPAAQHVRMRGFRHAKHVGQVRVPCAPFIAQ